MDEINSRQSAWRRIVASNRTAAIFEDDIAVDVPRRAYEKMLAAAISKDADFNLPGIAIGGVSVGPSDDDGEDADAFEDAAETLARGQDAAITTGLLSGVKKPASSHGTRSRRSGASTRRSGDATERGRKKSASGKSSKEALRRKAERRAYKPVTFTLLCRLFCLYASFMALVFAFVIVTALGAYLNPTGEVLELNALENVVWMIISVASFIAIPSAVAHVTAYLTWPPVWLEAYPDRSKLLEELGGKIYFRFHISRDAKPLAVKRAVDVAVDILQRAIPTTLFEIEVVTTKEIGVSSSCVSELVVPLEMNYKVQGSSGLLNFATRASSATWGDWVVHLGSDSLLNVRAVDAVLAHCARPASPPKKRMKLKLVAGSKYL